MAGDARFGGWWLGGWAWRLGGWTWWLAGCGRESWWLGDRGLWTVGWGLSSC